MSTRYAIENVNRPGRYWNPTTKQFNSELSGDYQEYRTEKEALRAARRIDTIYQTTIKTFVRNDQLPWGL